MGEILNESCYVQAWSSWQTRHVSTTISRAQEDVTSHTSETSWKDTPAASESHRPSCCSRSTSSWAEYIRLKEKEAVVVVAEVAVEAEAVAEAAVAEAAQDAAAEAVEAATAGGAGVVA